MTDTSSINLVSPTHTDFQEGHDIEKLLEDIAKNTFKERILLIGENHWSKIHTQTQRKIIRKVIGQTSNDNYVFCFEEGILIPDFPLIERTALMSDIYLNSQDNSYWQRSNDIAAEELLRQRQKDNRVIIAICGNGHLRYDYSIQNILRGKKTNPVTVMQDEQNPTIKLSDTEYNIASR